MMDEWKEIHTNKGVYEYREFKKERFEIRRKGETEPYLMGTLEGILIGFIENEMFHKEGDE